MICGDRDDSISYVGPLLFSELDLQRQLVVDSAWLLHLHSSMAFWAWLPVDADRISAGPPVVAREEPGWISF
jgi:hypothetical protein